MANLRTQAFRPRTAPSALPSLIIPCPRCGGRMTAAPTKPMTPTAKVIELPALEDIAHGCVRCGTELIRTVFTELHD
jgi:DNA-directed RNA polymerase subunit RPC12/RpoP